MKKKKQKVFKPANWNAYRNDSKFSRGWNSSYDKDGAEGAIYDRSVRGHPALGQDYRIYMRLTKQWSEDDSNDDLSNIILQINTQKSAEMPVKKYRYFDDAERKPEESIELRKIPDYNILQTNCNIMANPIRRHMDI